MSPTKGYVMKFLCKKKPAYEALEQENDEQLATRRASRAEHSKLQGEHSLSHQNYKMEMAAMCSCLKQKQSESKEVQMLLPLRYFALVTSRNR